jgi:hypothetical protein
MAELEVEEQGINKSNGTAGDKQSSGTVRKVVPPHEKPCNLEEAVLSWLPFVKKGSLFAEHPSDQAQLDAMMRYLEACCGVSVCEKRRSPACRKTRIANLDWTNGFFVQQWLRRERKDDGASSNDS